jgi:metal-responsive CopG/Arc/MetJ family transcriptional regulator
MPPRIEPDTPTERIQILAPRTWVEQVDDWRRRQEGHIPSRSEAIRVLVLMALSGQ